MVITEKPGMCVYPDESAAHFASIQSMEYIATSGYIGL